MDIFANWDNLPEEIQSHILTFLPASELQRIAKTSKNNFSLAFSNKLWQPIFTSLFEKDSSIICVSTYKNKVYQYFWYDIFKQKIGFMLEIDYIVKDQAYRNNVCSSFLNLYRLNISALLDNPYVKKNSLKAIYEELKQEFNSQKTQNQIITNHNITPNTYLMLCLLLRNNERFCKDFEHFYPLKSAEQIPANLVKKLLSFAIRSANDEAIDKLIEYWKARHAQIIDTYLGAVRDDCSLMQGLNLIHRKKCFNKFIEYAFKKRNEELLQLLFDKQIVIKINSKKHSSFNTILDYAIKTQSNQILRFLILHPKIDLQELYEQSSIKAYDCLANAIKTGNIETFLLLIQSIALNKQELNNVSLLHLAINSKNINAVSFLLKQGLNPNAKDARGFNALHLAAKNNDFATARLLLDFGADISAKTWNGAIAKELVSVKSQSKLIHLLTPSNLAPSEQKIMPKKQAKSTQAKAKRVSLVNFFEQHQSSIKQERNTVSDNQVTKGTTLRHPF